MNRSTFGKLFPIFLSVLWIFAVTFNYYIVHKPFGSENALAVLNALGDALTMLALYALAAALGRRALRAFQFDSPLEEIVVHTGLGLGVIAFATFALGLLGWLNPILFWLLLLAALALLRDDLRATWCACRSLDLPRATCFECWLAWFVALALAVAFLFALMPPTGWDGLQYHLVGPQRALAQGRILPPGDNLSLNFPALIEMLFLAAMALKSDSAAQLMHWGYAPLVVGALLVFARRYLTIRAGWLAAAILFAVPSFLRTATWAYNDIALAFYSTVALFLTLDARAKKSVRTFALAGIFAGLAMGEKYTAAFVALALVALIVRPQRATWRAAFVFSISAGIVAAPWLIRNWIFVGNPVYPFVWGGWEWDAFRAAWYSRFGTGLLSDPLRLLLAPWEATVWGQEDTAYFQATVGALLLVLIPLGVLTARREPADVRAPRAWWWFVGVLYVMWLIGVAQSKLLWQTRLLFPAFPVLALLAGEAFERLARLEVPQFSVQRFTMLVIGLVLGLTTFSYALAIAGDSPFAYIAGFESRRAYLTRALGSYYAAAEFANDKLSKDARVLFLWETRPYYFQRAVDEDAILDRWARLHRLGDADSIAVELGVRGYTHVLLYRGGLDLILQTGYDPAPAEDMRTLQDFVTRYLRPVYGRTSFQIVTRGDKPAVLNAPEEPYTVYEILGRSK
jgi:hypothetical protein